MSGPVTLYDECLWDRRLSRAGAGGRGVWIMCVVLARRTGGAITREQARMWGSAADVRRAVDAGLLVEVPGGYEVTQEPQRGEVAAMPSEPARTVTSGAERTRRYRERQASRAVTDRHADRHSDAGCDAADRHSDASPTVTVTPAVTPLPPGPPNPSISSPPPPPPPARDGDGSDASRDAGGDGRDAAAAGRETGRRDVRRDAGSDASVTLAAYDQSIASGREWCERYERGVVHVASHGRAYATLSETLESVPEALRTGLGEYLVWADGERRGKRPAYPSRKPHLGFVIEHMTSLVAAADDWLSRGRVAAPPAPGGRQTDADTFSQAESPEEPVPGHVVATPEQMREAAAAMRAHRERMGLIPKRGLAP